MELVGDMFLQLLIQIVRGFQIYVQIYVQIELFWVFSPIWFYSVKPYGLTVLCIPPYYIMICSIQVQISVMG